MFKDYQSESIEQAYVKGSHYFLTGGLLITLHFDDTIFINNQKLLWKTKEY
ncbi:MAG: hypothetical protein LBG59_02440 [Candidatus Peribacteria bacterium]|jgi:hypothetical protein|nr:hypothetical protein [Candidatus Peribacteria bacterium]